MQSDSVVDKENYSKTSSNEPKINNDLPAYDISLIGALESDHDQLLDLFTNIISSAQNKDFVVLKLDLGEFASSFTDHIQVEDEHLYGYLKTMAKNKSKLEQKIVADFSSEMKNISISILTFLTQGPYIPVDESNVDIFISEFQKIGLLLQNRISREENILYPRYTKTRRVVDIT